ncbi:TlpA disulfide reductase family protein [Sporolactobacillus sp. STCC-11]|uniref:TlpA family protein disulfide reductase n=1 Tax=Sporolactobacillus caesalpiniae TaxID=3230362 RepID=UPI00339870D4
MKKKLMMPDLNVATHWMNQKVTREMLLGSPTLIHFWSVSCPKCKQALPVVQSIREKYRGILTVVAIHMPLSEADLDVNEVARTAAMHSITEPILIDNTHRLADAFGNRFVPAYYLFAPEGKLIEYHMGERGALRIYKVIDRLLN